MADEQKPGGSEAAPPPGARPRNNRRNQPPKPRNRRLRSAAPASRTPETARRHGGHTRGRATSPRELKERFGDGIIETSTYLGQNFIVAKPDAAIPILEYLKLEADFDYLVDITAVDWPKRAERFDVVYILYSFARNERVRVKIHDRRRLSSRRPPWASTSPPTGWSAKSTICSASSSRATPTCGASCMPDEWQGYPLRKDYGILQQDQRWVQENLGIESGQ